MTFQSLSESPFVLPGLAWLALPIVLAFALRRRGFFRVWGLVFGALIALDAWLTGPLSPVSDERSGWATFFGVAFVLVGDLRFFVAAEWDAGRARASLARAFGLAWIAPLASQLARALVPSIAATPRLTYLVYELIFLVVLAGWYLGRARRWSGARRVFASRLAAFFALQYALWAGADVLLLATSADLGYGLRMAPNVLYYVLFVPYVLMVAPEPEAR
ncbi:MAG: hypothetical protein KF901_34855 [Myxococcales bacterium]|nr:hypothetical protein [Myxococcales bacterium]